MIEDSKITSNEDILKMLAEKHKGTLGALSE